MIVIRTEQSEDQEPIGQLIEDAFSHSQLGHHGEADLVEQLRGACDQTLSLVAVKNSEVVGHVLFSPVIIDHAEQSTTTRGVRGMGLGPMAVAVRYQNQGIGTKLIESALELLEPRKCPFVAVIGHPDFYQRFGFVPASNYSISHAFRGIPQDVLFIKRLIDNPDCTPPSGTIFFRPEFGEQTESFS